MSHHPKRGSKQYWPRKRAQRSYARVGSWSGPAVEKGASLLGFIGYKVGMSSANIIDNFSHTLTKGTMINVPITIVECPPIEIIGVRVYGKGLNGGKELIGSLQVKAANKHVERRVKMPKKASKPDTEKFVASVQEHGEEVRVVVATQPHLTCLGKKKPEICEIGVGGSFSDALTFACEKLGTVVKLSEVCKSGELLDSHAITKGKGFQGAVKRFGVSLPSHKSEKKRRHSGTLGAWHPSRILTTVPQPGQMGFHQRVDWNKWILKIGEVADDISPTSGFHKYGIIKNEYLVMKGSLQGPAKRMITFVKATRPNKRYPTVAPEILSVKK